MLRIFIIQIDRRVEAAIKIIKQELGEVIMWIEQRNFLFPGNIYKNM